MKFGTYSTASWLVGITTGVGIMTFEDNIALSLLCVALGGVAVLVLGWSYITSQGN